MNIRNLLFALLLTSFSSLFAQQTTPAPTEEKTAIIDTAKLRVLKDSINGCFKQFFDVDMLIKCVQVRQISNVKGFSLLKKNQPLADTISLFEKGYGANIFVNSYVNSDQLWPKVFGNKDKITNLIDDKKNMPAVGFDIRFTPHGNGKDRVFNVDILNKSSEGLLDANKQSILQQVTQKGLSKPFDKVSPYAKDSVNNAMFLGIDALRGMIEQQANQCNIAHVAFEACTNQKYGFDVLPHNILTSYYEELNIKGSKYEVPWKSVAANMPDCVTAKLVLLNKNAPTHEVKFRSTNASMVVTPNPNDGTYQISFTGGSNKSEESIVAYYTETLLTGKEKETIVGKLKLISYAPETKKLVPVLLNNVNFSCNETELQKVLNNIYKQAAVNWTVGTPIKREVKSWDKDNDGKLLIETSPFSRYSKEMDAIIDAIKTDPETYYVIITNIPNSQGYAGYMPLKSDFAFFFTSPSGGGQEGAYQTIAHEMGHGAFYLKHISDEYKINDASDNLMNRYAVGTSLWKPQWDWIGDPSWRLYMFQKEEDGALIIPPGIYFWTLASGWTVSKYVSMTYNDETLNTLGYFTHLKINELEKERNLQAKSIEEARRRLEQEIASYEYARSQNIFYIIYQLSPASSATYATINFSKGEYGWGTFNAAICLLGAAQLKSLISCAGKGIIKNSNSVIDDIWKQGDINRNIIFRNALTKTLYNSVDEIAEAKIGLLPVIDVLESGTGVAFRAVNDFVSYEKGLLRTIDDLAKAKQVGSVAGISGEVRLSGVRLDIAVPKGGLTAVPPKVISQAKNQGVTLRVFEVVEESGNIVAKVAQGAGWTKYVDDFFANAKVITSKNRILNKELDKVYTQLSVEEITAIHHYTTGAYRDFNAALRAANGNISALNEFNRAFYEILQSGMQKMPNKFTGQLYRGTSLSEEALLKYKNAFQNKTGVTEYSYNSTSQGTDVYKKFQNLTKQEGDMPVLIFVNAKGKYGVDIDGISRYGKNFTELGGDLQSEVLYMSGAKFKVTEYVEDISTEGQKYVKMVWEEIP